jgi:2-oxo-3-hexenedioate decarboxylase
MTANTQGAHSAITLSPEEIEAEARRLVAAAAAHRTTRLPSATHPELTIEDGYAIQGAAVAQRVESGDRVIGAKLGLTSRAKQEAMGLDEVAVGMVLASTVETPDAPIDLRRYIHPRAEPEIVFRMGERLAGPGVGPTEVLAAAAGIGCGFELIDSRFEDFRFGMADVIADNTSAAGLVLGSDWVAPESIPDLADVEMVLYVNGERADAATGAAILGHPAIAVAELADWLGARGRAIEPGWLVWSGAMTAPVPLTPGLTVAATFGGIGSAVVTVADPA